MPKSPTDAYFDRRVPEELMDALRPGGFAHSLVEYARSGQYGLDLALRADVKSNESRATLYVGTTKALDLHYLLGKGFSLGVHDSWKKTGPWDPSWTKRANSEQQVARWPAVERFVESCIANVVGKGAHIKEGVVQAGFSRFGDGNPCVVDREAVVGYRNEATKARLLKQTRAPLQKFLTDAAADPGQKWLKPALKSTECDALAISKSGDLLTVEIKPDSAGANVAFAPLQAWQYARQFQQWIDCYEEAGLSAHDVILGMYEQRRELGLSVGRERPALAKRLKVIPVVAVRPGCSQTVRKRVARVVELIREADQDTPAMQFYTLNLVGRMDPFDPLEPDSWAKA